MTTGMEMHLNALSALTMVTGEISLSARITTMMEISLSALNALNVPTMVTGEISLSVPMTTGMETCLNVATHQI
jgi:phosphoribosyl-dephospho-CoA transferase